MCAAAALAFVALALAPGASLPAQGGWTPPQPPCDALDSLNRASLKLVAAGWDFRGGRDSTKAYAARADSGLAVEISAPSFVPDTAGASLAAAALNPKSTASTPFRLTFEFLNASDQVVATACLDVPSLAPRQNHAFELQVSGKRIAGWRYRAS